MKTSATTILIATCAIALSGCASLKSGDRAAADTLRTCERVIYQASDAPRDTALRCAEILGIWR